MAKDGRLVSGRKACSLEVGDSFWFLVGAASKFAPIKASTAGDSNLDMEYGSFPPGFPRSFFDWRPPFDFCSPFDFRSPFSRLVSLLVTRPSVSMASLLVLRPASFERLGSLERLASFLIPETHFKVGAELEDAGGAPRVHFKVGAELEDAAGAP